MAKFYKIGFWASLLITAFLIIFLRVSKVGYEKELKLIIQMAEKRSVSLMSSNTIFNRKLNPINGQNIITKELQNNLFQDTVLVILLDKFKCSKCQENELKRLDSLKLFFESKSLNVFGITSKSQKDVVIRQRKLSKITYPIYWVEDSVFYNLNIIQRFPQILLVSENVVLSQFFPVVKDDEFSKLYYTDFINKLELQ